MENGLSLPLCFAPCEELSVNQAGASLQRFPMQISQTLASLRILGEAFGRG